MKGVRLINRYDIFFLNNLSNEEISLLKSLKGNKKITLNKKYVKENNVVKSIINKELLNSKKILIISDDEEDLISINDILKYISSKALLLNDKINCSDIYMRIEENFNNISKNTGKTILSKINLLSKDIDRKIDALNNIKNAFTRVNECGLTLLDMYAITEKSVGKYDDRNEFYRIFRIKNPFSEFSYEELNNITIALNDDSIVKEFVKYKRLFGNASFEKFRDDINIININTALDEINYIADNPDIAILSDVTSEYFDEVLEFYIKNKEISDTEIKNFSKELNKKYNLKYFPKENENHHNIFNKLLNRFKKRKIDFEKEELEIIKCENTIYREVKNTIRSLDKFINTFKFLKNILNKDEYNLIIEKILNKEKVFDYLEKLKTSLSNFILFKELEINIDGLDKDKIQVLEYCYENVENKKDIKSLINMIPNLYLLLKIEEIELKEKNNISYYRDYSILVNEIKKEIDNKVSLVDKGIKYQWDNILSTKIQECNKSKEEILTLLKHDLNVEIDFVTYIEKYNDFIFNTFPCIIINKKMLDTLPESIIQSFDLNINFTEEEITETISCDFMYSYNIEVINDFFKNQLYKQLLKLGYVAKKDVILENKYIPLLIQSKNDHIPSIIIELDYLSYYNEYDTRINDIGSKYTSETLDTLENSTVIRLWSRDWWTNRKKEISKIEQIMDNCCNIS